MSSPPPSSFFVPPSYTIPPPAQKCPADRREETLLSLQRELQEYNDLRMPVSYDRDLRGWKPYQRPYVQALTTKDDAIPLEASEAARLTDPWSRPICPHVDIECSVEEATMDLVLGEIYQGKNVDLFRAPSHTCSFEVILPSIDECEILKSASVFNSEPIKTITPSMGVIFTPKMSVKAPANPRISSLLYFDPPERSPRPQKRFKFASPKPFFGPAMAEARRCSDRRLIADVHFKARTGVFKEYPERHPAALGPQCHTLLEPYNTSRFPRCNSIVLEFTHCLGSVFVRPFREYLSPYGLPMSILSLLLKDAVTCPACCCVFSLVAYNLHLEEESPMQMRCKNSYSRISPKKEISRWTAKEEAIMKAFLEEEHFEADTYACTRSPLGVAFLSWNSILGVPQDVWTILSTAEVECPRCDLARPYKEHVIHESFCSEAGWDDAKRHLRASLLQNGPPSAKLLD